MGTSNLTSGFIDLATYDELEKYMYGGNDATSYFVRQTRKATWFTQVPVVLSRGSGSPTFGSEWSVTISRAGDYLLQAWLRVEIPAVENTFDLNGSTSDKYIGWTPNLGHNLIQECSISFNDLVAARFDRWHLDFYSAFATPAGKVDGYYQMIGTLTDLTNIYGPEETIPSRMLNIPLPLFFTRDSGVALPTAALPYNEMRINFRFADWTDLLCQYLIVDDTLNSSLKLAVPQASPVWTNFTGPSLGTVQVWANYAIVSNDERKRMACAPRDILIEQVQTAPPQSFSPINHPNPSYDIRFSHAIKVLFFAAQNISCKTYGSNYTTQHSIPVIATTGARNVHFVTNYFPGKDPVDTTTLTYENTQRLSAMGSDYFSLVQPYYTAPIIPLQTGYHMYSYSLDFVSLDPLGSTNYGKLTNVSIAPTPSKPATWAANPSPSDDSLVNTDPNTWQEQYPDKNDASTDKNFQYSNTFRFLVTAVNNNIIRVSGGALGFPVL